MATAAERQKKFRQLMADKGMVEVSGWVPREHGAAVKDLMLALSSRPHCEIGPLRNTATGKLERL